MGQTSNNGWYLLSSVVVCNAGGGDGRVGGRRAGRRARGRSAAGRVGGRHSTAGQYGYVLLGRHLVTRSNALKLSHKHA